LKGSGRPNVARPLLEAASLHGWAWQVCSNLFKRLGQGLGVAHARVQVGKLTRVNMCLGNLQALPRALEQAGLDKFEQTSAWPCAKGTQKGAGGRMPPSAFGRLPKAASLYGWAGQVCSNLSKQARSSQAPWARLGGCPGACSSGLINPLQHAPGQHPRLAQSA
jgi:hypothetical protein